MEKLLQRYYERYARVDISTIRDIENDIDWSNRMIAILGSRGVGKTTLLLQHLKKHYKPDGSALYVSLDNLYFAENKLYDLADSFSKRGGKILAIDEVHRYPNWASELKNIYDDFEDLKIVFTGSSILQIRNTSADLSRRMVRYELPGLSFREFLKFEAEISFQRYSLTDILDNHVSIAIEIISKVKPLAWFDNYLQYGYYPFYMENTESFQIKLSEVMAVVLEIDIAQYESIQIGHIAMLKKLMQVISSSAPFSPNLNSVSQRTGITVNTLKKYLSYLNSANLIASLFPVSKGINSLGKPAKIYLDNTNLMYALDSDLVNLGNVRETYFYNQMSQLTDVFSSKMLDFELTDGTGFEIGGKGKNEKQTIDFDGRSFLVKDDIEVGSEGVIPLWLFGFMY